MAKQPKNPFHPGQILLEEFPEPKGTRQAAFAEQIGWTKTRLNEFIKGKRGITAAAAVEGEIANVAIYDRVSRSTQRPDILSVCNALREASLDRHLPAFRRCVERENR